MWSRGGNDQRDRLTHTDHVGAGPFRRLSYPEVVPQRTARIWRRVYPLTIYASLAQIVQLPFTIVGPVPIGEALRPQLMINFQPSRPAKPGGNATHPANLDAGYPSNES